MRRVKTGRPESLLPGQPAEPKLPNSSSVMTLSQGRDSQRKTGYTLFCLSHVCSNSSRYHKKTKHTHEAEEEEEWREGEEEEERGKREEEKREEGGESWLPGSSQSDLLNHTDSGIQCTRKPDVSCCGLVIATLLQVSYCQHEYQQGCSLGGKRYLELNPSCKGY